MPPCLKGIYDTYNSPASDRGNKGFFGLDLLHLSRPLLDGNSCILPDGATSSQGKAVTINFTVASSFPLRPELAHPIAGMLVAVLETWA